MECSTGVQYVPVTVVHWLLLFSVHIHLYMYMYIHASFGKCFQCICVQDTEVYTEVGTYMYSICLWQCMRFIVH